MKRTLFRSLSLIPLFTIACQPAAEENGTGSENLRIVEVPVIELEKQPGYTVKESFLGTIEARRSTMLRFEVAGTIIALAADEGHQVDKGQELGLLDTARLEARLAEAEAQIAEAEAQRTLARTTLERAERLKRSQAVSQQDVDEALQQRDAAAARIRLAQARADAIRVDLEKSILRAPFSGTITSRMTDEGAVVSVASPVLELRETAALESRIAVPRTTADNLTPGDTVSVMTELAPEAQSWEVTRILPQRDPLTRTIDIIVTPPSEIRDSLRDGDFITLKQVTAVSSPGFALPRDALTESVRGLWACYVAVPTAEDGTYELQLRDLELLHEDADQAFVRGPLASGDLVLATGLHKHAPGQRVSVRTFTGSETETRP